MNTSFFQRFIEEIPPLTRKFVERKAGFSAKVVEILESTGTTQRELSEKLGKKESYVSRILSGNANPTLKTIVQLEIALGKDVIDFHVAPKAYQGMSVLYHQSSWGESDNKVYSIMSSASITVDGDPYSVIEKSANVA